MGGWERRIFTRIKRMGRIETDFFWGRSRRESHAEARRTRGRIRFNRMDKDGKRRLRTGWKKCGRDTTGRTPFPRGARARSPLSRGTVIFTRYFDSPANTGMKDSDSLTGMSDWGLGNTGRCPVLCPLRAYSPHSDLFSRPICSRIRCRSRGSGGFLCGSRRLCVRFSGKGLPSRAERGPAPPC